MSEIKNRIDFIYMFDVKDGNPNGDPDAGNLPRIDAETGMGLVTDVCLKRKIRNYVQIVKDCTDGYDIFIKERAILGDLYEEVFKSVKKDSKNARKEMCNRYFDVRTFGAVIKPGDNYGQVRGPIQLTFARSVNPINSLEHTITRMAVANKDKGANDKKSVDHTMGRKSTVPYGLYVCYGFVSANLAQQTGFSEDDLQLLWDALKNMFDHDHSAARGLMAAQKLYVFKHQSQLGNCPANKLFDLVKINCKNAPARSFSDYEVIVDANSLPQGVTVDELIDGKV